MTAALRLAARLLTDLHARQAEPGLPLRAQQLADQWGVSRSPVNAALAVLHARGLILHAPGKGYTAGPLFSQDAARALRSGFEGGCNGHGDGDADGNGDNDAAPDRPSRHAADHDRPGGRLAGIASDTHAHLCALLDRLDPSGISRPPSLTDLCHAIADDRRAGLLPDTVSEAQLQSRYQLTRGGLAILLGQLAHDGWVDRHAGQGWIFSPLLTSPDALLQASRSRMVLEIAALKEPGYGLAPDALARCREAERRIEGTSATDLHARGVRFHQTLAAGSHNRFLFDALNRIHRLRTALPHAAIQDPARVREQAADHLAILDALARGRTRHAVTLLRRHLRTAHDDLEQALALNRLRQPA